MAEAPSLDSTLGALQIGTLLAVYLFGIITFQAYEYFRNFKSDRPTFKTLVAVIWLLECAHTICGVYEVYRSTITLYGQPEKLTRFPILGVATALGGMITFLTHTFFSVRLWRVLPKPWGYVGPVCIVIALARLVGAIGLGVAATTAANVVEYRINYRWLILTLLSVGAALDFVIAVSMVYYLLQKRQISLARSTGLIDRLVVFTVRSGALTSVCALALLIVFLMLPDTLVWIAIYTCLAKIYSNSLISALNERTALRKSAVGSSMSLEPRSAKREPGDPNRIVISVQTKSAVHADGFEHRPEKTYRFHSMTSSTPDDSPAPSATGKAV